MALTDLDRSPLPRLDLRCSRITSSTRLTKGLPLDAPAMRLRDIGEQGWNVLAGDLPLPLAVIRRDVLKANSALDERFTAENGLVIAPHGKTTMAPQLFDLQIADGAWAITVATVQQLEVCRHFGVRRVIIANQPIGAQSVDACFGRFGQSVISSSIVSPTACRESRFWPKVQGATPPPAGNPLRVLVEIGFMGGRTGARSRDGGARGRPRHRRHPGLALAGFECFEGLLPDPAAADGLIDEVAAIARLAKRKACCRPGRR